MARTISVAENHHLLRSSSHTARTSRSLKKRIDFLLISPLLFRSLVLSFMVQRYKKFLKTMRLCREKTLIYKKGAQRKPGFCYLIFLLIIIWIVDAFHEYFAIVNLICKSHKDTKTFLITIKCREKHSKYDKMHHLSLYNTLNPILIQILVEILLDSGRRAALSHFVRIGYYK